jgi:hypothetical protein
VLGLPFGYSQALVDPSVNYQKGTAEPPDPRRLCDAAHVEEAFAYVLFGTVLVSAIAAVASLHGDRYGHIGRGGLLEPDRDAPPTPAAVRDEEIRQLVEARETVRAARGRPGARPAADRRRIGDGTG